MNIVPLRRSLCLLAVGIGLIACSDNPTLNTHHKDNGLKNHPPAQGKCAGWQRSLSEGKKQQDVAYCLRELARTNRAEAVAEATIMADWPIKLVPNSDLPELIAAMHLYPQPGQLLDYLSSLGLLAHNWQQLPSPEYAITASDYLSSLAAVAWFDTETGFFPNEHDGLLHMLAKHTDLSDVKFEEVAPPYSSSDRQPYQLFAEVNGHRYQQQAQNYGDWYDVVAVLDLLNKVAQQEQRRSRFIQFASTDQGSIVWVVDKQPLASLYQAGLLRYEPYVLAIDIGKASEAKVLSSVPK
ncbi:hypothetical protein [Motilimonas pumila]|nr:hypothetical protein [Motilimonas pumila]